MANDRARAHTDSLGLGPHSTPHPMVPPSTGTQPQPLKTTRKLRRTLCTSAAEPSRRPALSAVRPCRCAPGTHCFLDPLLSHPSGARCVVPPEEASSDLKTWSDAHSVSPWHPARALHRACTGGHVYRYICSSPTPIHDSAGIYCMPTTCQASSPRCQ